MYRQPVSTEAISGQRVSEATADMTLGMNMSLDTSRLEEGQFAKGVNVSIRGGSARTRPGWVRRNMQLPIGSFQGATIWPRDEVDFFVAVVSGVVVVRNLSTNAGDNFNNLLSTTVPLCYMTPVDRYMVIQDGVNEPVILEYDPDAETVTQYTGPSGIPTGRVMIYSQARLHVSPIEVDESGVDGRYYFQSGDTIQPDAPFSVLDFTETGYLASGRAHSLPVDLGEIRAMGAMRNAPTGTGAGDVFVFGAYGAAAFASSVPRNEWSTTPVMQVLFMDYGAVGPYALANVNSDMYFRSADGIRALSYTFQQSRGAAGSLVNLPMSEEVYGFLDSDGEYASRSSLAVWDNQLFCTCDADSQGRFRALLHMDAAIRTALGRQQASPAWSGVWTGLPFRFVFTGRVDGIPRLLTVSDASGVWMLDDTALVDNENFPIESRLDTRALDGGESVSLKQLERIDIHLTDVKVTTEVTVRVRPYGYPLWAEAGTQTITVPEGSLPHAPRRLRFSVDRVEALCDPVSKRPLSIGRAFQISVEWKGNARIDAIIAGLVVRGEEQVYSREITGDVLTASADTGAELDDYGYQFAAWEVLL